MTDKLPIFRPIVPHRAPKEGEWYWSKIGWCVLRDDFDRCADDIAYEAVYADTPPANDDRVAAIQRQCDRYREAWLDLLDDERAKFIRETAARIFAPALSSGLKGDLATWAVKSAAMLADLVFPREKTP